MEIKGKNESKLERKLSQLRKLPEVFDTGRIPPQAVDLEEAVLGALMLEKEAVNDVIDFLVPEAFYKDSHQKIYAAIRNLFDKQQPIDILTVTEQLKSEGILDVVGGPFFISQLTSKVASAANIEFHGRIINQKYICRELIKISSETIQLGYDETIDVFDLLDKTERDLYRVAEGNMRKDFEGMDTLIFKAIKNIEAIKDKKDGLSGVPSGFSQLDRITSGFQPSDMIVLAARPGMGKTSFVLSLARNASVDFNQPVMIFSLEMSAVQLVNRLISAETQLSADKLRKGRLETYEWEQLNSKIDKLSKAKIFIDDTPGLNIFELRAKCRRLKSQHNIQMVIIDYLQLMNAGTDSTKGGNREQEISTISRSIKGLAKELNIPIIALSQLSRAVETRAGDKKPMLSDLRESGAIEQDADMVMFIYRPEYYQLKEYDEGQPTDGVAEIIVAKHRNGATDTAKIKWVAQYAKFEDFDFDNNQGSTDFSLKPNVDFGVDEQPSVIRGSRMNDDFSIDDNSPLPYN